MFLWNCPQGSYLKVFSAPCGTRPCSPLARAGGCWHSPSGQALLSPPLVQAEAGTGTSTSLPHPVCTWAPLSPARGHEVGTVGKCPALQRRKPRPRRVTRRRMSELGSSRGCWKPLCLHPGPGVGPHPPSGLVPGLCLRRVQGRTGKAAWRRRELGWGEGRLRRGPGRTVPCGPDQGRHRASRLPGSGKGTNPGWAVVGRAVRTSAQALWAWPLTSGQDREGGLGGLLLPPGPGPSLTSLPAPAVQLLEPARHSPFCSWGN